MGNYLTGDEYRLIAFQGLRAADFSRFFAVATPLFGEAHHAR